MQVPIAAPAYEPDDVPEYERENSPVFLSITKVSMECPVKSWIVIIPSVSPRIFMGLVPPVPENATRGDGVMRPIKVICSPMSLRAVERTTVPVSVSE